MRRALDRALRRGTSFGAPTELEVRLAEKVSKLVPSIEMVRFVNSGTEATMSAVRLARGATGRKRIVKTDGGYHGHADGFLVSAGSGVATLGIAGSPGVPDEIAALTTVVPYNDASALEEAFRKFPGEIAAFVVEPVAANMGLVLPAPGYLEAARELTRRHGALLVFDEVISGFRVAAGGAQELYGVRPDLTTLGKILGGGLPIGAYGGPRDLMEKMAPSGPVYQAGTLSGNPLATSAGLAMLGEIELRPPYAKLEARGALLESLLCRGHRGAGPGRPSDARAPGLAAHAVLREGPPRRLRGDPKLRHEALRRLLPRDARARRVSASGAVRSVVRVHRARRGRDPQDGAVRGRRARRRVRLRLGLGHPRQREALEPFLADPPDLLSFGLDPGERDPQALDGCAARSRETSRTPRR